MSGLYDDILYDDFLYDGESSSSGGSTAPAVRMRVYVDDMDETSRLYSETGDTHYVSVNQTQNGTTGTIWMQFDEGETLPPVGAVFEIRWPSGKTTILIADQISRVKERYHDLAEAEWLHEFNVVDPITRLSDDALPSDQRPYTNRSTGYILDSLLSQMDSRIQTTLATGNTIAGLNLREFTTLADLLRSEVTSGGYSVRMEDGWNARGGFEEDFMAQSDWAIDQTDPRYTPSRFEVLPGNKLIKSVTVAPSRDVPTNRGAVYSELDARAMNSILLDGNPFNLENAQVLKITTGQDITDDEVWEVTGSVGMTGSHIALNSSTLTLLEARPFVAPYACSWSGIIPDIGTGFTFGFKDDTGAYVWSVTSADFPLEADDGVNQHTYEIFTAPTGPFSFSVWGLHRSQKSDVDIDEILATVSAVDYDENTITISAAWTVNNNYVRVMRDGGEIGRARILRISGSTLFCEEPPPDIQVGDDVTRGLDVDAYVEITHIKDVSVTANTCYGLPTISGSVHLGAFVIQETGQIEGLLLSESNRLPQQTYPRGMNIGLEATEFTDAVVTGGGGGAQVTLDTKFSHDKRVEVVFNYVIGGKHEFKSRCGSEGGHITVPVDQEQDPAVLAALASRLCALGTIDAPRITSNMESTEIEGLPLPYDPMPVNLHAQYRCGVSSLPLISCRIDYKGAAFGDTNEDVLLYTMDAGYKSPEERAREETQRGTPLTKYPLRRASIGGVRITGVSWDDETASVSVSGGGTAYGPRGEAFSLGGFSPAEVAGIADKHRQPVTVRATVVSGNLAPDVLSMTFIYPPAPINAATLKTHYNGLTDTVKFRISPASGARGYDVQHRVDPDGDGAYEWQRRERVTVPEFEMPYEPNSKKIRVRPIGFCDKTQDYVELEANLPQLPAPTLFDVIKVKANDKVVFRVSAPPTGANITGRSRFLKILVRQTTDAGLVIDGREDFPADTTGVVTWMLPIQSKTDVDRYEIEFEDTEADDIVWVAACWVDGFGDEGAITAPFDATRPPLTVGHVDIADFFQSAPQSSGGTVEDDNEETERLDFTGVFRIHLGRHNEEVRFFYEESEVMATATSTPTWGGKTHHFDKDVNDTEAAQGYVDAVGKQVFRYSKNKFRAIRIHKIGFRGPKVRERIGPDEEEEAARETVYLRGYQPPASAPAIVPHETDAVFNSTAFNFVPGKGGLANTFDTITTVRIDQKNDGFMFDWDRIKQFADFYVILIGMSPFGTRGPGSDVNIDADLDAITTYGPVTVYEPTNTTRSVSVTGIIVGNVGRYVFHNGQVIAGITLEEDTTYYLSVLARKKSGRWSANFSPVLDSETGAIVSGPAVDEGPPGVPAITAKWKKARGARVVITPSATNDNTLHDFEVGFFYPKTATGLSGSRRNFFHPDTGAATGVYEEGVSTTATFGKTGNSGFFNGGGHRFDGDALKADLPAGAISGGIGVICRAYNKVFDSGTGTIIDGVSTAGASFPKLTGTGTTTISESTILGDPRVEDDVDAGAVTSLEIVWKEKFGFKTKYGKPTTGANSFFATLVSYYYYDGTNTYWMHPETGALAATTSGSPAGFDERAQTYTARGDRDHHTTGVKFETLYQKFAQFGVKARVRGINIQGGVEDVSDTFAETSLQVPGADFISDRDAPNWVNSTAQASIVQSNLSLEINRKSLNANWDEPTHLQSVPDATPHIVKYGYKLRAGDDSSNWLSPLVPGTPVTVEASAEFFTKNSRLNLGVLRSAMASVFYTNGLKLAVRAYSYVAGVLTAGPWTVYTPVASVAADGVSEDIAHAGAVQNPVLRWKKHSGFASDWDKSISNANSVFAYLVSYYYYDGTNTHFMHPETGAKVTVSGAPGAIDERGQSYSKKVRKSEHTTNLSRGEIDPAFTTNAMKVRVRAINVINGVETISDNTAESSTQSSGTDFPQDTAPPGAGTLSAPRTKFTNIGFKFTVADMPTQNMKTFDKVTVFIHDGTTAWHPETGATLPLATALATTGSAVEINLKQEGGQTFNFKKTTSPVSGWTNIFARYRVYNDNTSGVAYRESVDSLAIPIAGVEGDATVAPPPAPLAPAAAPTGANNAIDSTGVNAMALVTFTIATVGGLSFDNAAVNATRAFVILRDGADDKVFESIVIPDRTLTSVKVVMHLPLGRAYTLRYFGLGGAGGDTKSTAVNFAFVAGVNGVPALVSLIATKVGNNHSKVVLTLSQTNPPTPIRSVVFFQTVNGVREELEARDCLNNPRLHNSSGTKTIRGKYPNTGSSTVLYDVELYLAGNATPLTITSGQVTSDADPPNDTGAPDAPAVVVVPMDGKLEIMPASPTINNKTRLRYQVALSRFASSGAATDPGTSPAEGTLGVHRLRPDVQGSCVFKFHRVSLSVDSLFYVIYVRVSNIASGLFSTWTRVNVGTRDQTNIGRPQDDGNGTAVPTLDTGGILGWTNFASGSLSGTRVPTPIKVQYEGSGNPNPATYTASVIQKSNDPNYTKLKGWKLQVWRKQGAKFKIAFSVPAVAGASITFAEEVTWSPVIRVQLQNNFLDDGRGGLSDWSAWVDALADGTALGSDGSIVPHDDTVQTLACYGNTTIV